MSGKAVTLTFDNGPTPGVTEHVLDVLKDHGVRSTFFVIGDNLDAPGGRALAERAVAEGHWVGNHTKTHSVQFGDHPDPSFGAQEIEGAQRSLGTLAHEDKLFRPYGGGGILSRSVFSTASVEHLCRERYTCVLWNSVPHDWDGPDQWVDWALGDIEREPWTVVVVHDIASGAMAHLPEFLDRLKGMGIEVRQDFPDVCVPIRRGQQAWSLEHLTAA